MAKFMRSSLEQQFQSLPEDVRFCKKCVVSNQRPKISFNEDGVCSACENSGHKDSIDWKQRELELEQLLDKHRRNDGRWDVLVPASGGKDSCFVAHELKYKWGMNPLTVTWSPLLYTDIGRKNWQSFIDSGFTNILYSPNGDLQRKLARLCLEEMGDAFHTFVLGQVNYPFHMALKMGIDLVFYGENGEAEYAGDFKSVDRPSIGPEDWKRNYFKGCSFDDLIEYGLQTKDYLTETDINKADLSFYRQPSLEKLQAAGLKKYFYSYFHKWVPQENYYYAVENCNFEANPERSEGTYSKYASLDDKTDGFHHYLGFIKFGIGRATQDAGHEIRDGHLTREEGVALVKKYDGEFPSLYFKEFLEYLDINEDTFWDITDSWRRSNIWKQEGGEWKLRHQVD